MNEHPCQAEIKPSPKSSRITWGGPFTIAFSKFKPIINCPPSVTVSPVKGKMLGTRADIAFIKQTVGEKLQFFLMICGFWNREDHNRDECMARILESEPCESLEFLAWSERVSISFGFSKKRIGTFASLTIAAQRMRGLWETIGLPGDVEGGRWLASLLQPRLCSSLARTDDHHFQLWALL